MFHWFLKLAAEIQLEKHEPPYAVYKRLPCGNWIRAKVYQLKIGDVFCYDVPNHSAPRVCIANPKINNHGWWECENVWEICYEDYQLLLIQQEMGSR